MKRHLIISGVLLALITTLSGCEAIAGIFKAGVWSGVLMVFLGIGLVVFLVVKLFKKK